jgi:DNA primase
VPQPRPSDPALEAEREALKLAIQRPALLGVAFDALEAETFTVAAHTAVHGAIAAAGGAAAGANQPPDAWASAVIQAAADDQVRSLITQLVVEPVRSADEPDARYASELLARLRVHVVDRLVAEAKSRLQRLDPVSQAEEYQAAFADLLSLEQRRREDLERTHGD